MTDYMVTGLERRRAELAGRVYHLQSELADLVKDVEHIDAVLRIVAPERDITAIAPKLHIPPEHWSKRGEMSRQCFAILRLSRVPLTSRQIATQLIMDRGLASTPQMLVTLTKRVNGCLRDRRKQGLVRNAGNEDSMWLLWELVR